MPSIRTLLGAAWFCSSALTSVHGANVTFDASMPPPAVETGYLSLGTATAPDGQTLGATNRYLTLDNKPWLPVMGEIHFVRLPADRWDDALGKIKASGVDIVATYMFWNYHEDREGHFDFSGDRDVRRFLQLAKKHQLKVVLRLGPWSHGEVRFGGLPDWVIRAMPARGNDPTYMSYVRRYWTKIAEQARGLLWKDGGPIIGVQLENEYNLTGPNQGRNHIAALRKLAIDLGFDVPLYTVTGWDGAVYPRHDVTPVFGGYPDEPWGITGGRLPPKETYAFRFSSRVSGNLGAQTQGGPEGGDADADIPHTPFLGAEFGGGLPTMYRRRPVVTPDDIASMLPVELGSGVNLYGYYMYHGGRNLIAGTTLEESSAIGGFNDMPLIDYDFQAPLGEYDQQNPVLTYLRPFHLFLEQWGSALAPMTVRPPNIQPKALGDLQTIRASLRSDGTSAFLFVNNHVRQYAMAPQEDTRFTVRLGDRTVTFPQKGITIPQDAYFIWPVGLPLDDARLEWATVQPVTRLAGAGGTTYVFSASDGIAPQLSIGAASNVVASRGHVTRTSDGWQVDQLAPGTDCTVTIVTAGGRDIQLVVLKADQARSLTKVHYMGADRLLLTKAEVNDRAPGLSLRSVGKPNVDFALYPAPFTLPIAKLKLTATGHNGIFAAFRADFADRSVPVTMRMLRKPEAAPPINIGGPAKGAIPPYPEAFAHAGAWTINLPPKALDGLDDAFLELDWTGDVARLFSGASLLDDRFYDGRKWPIGLSEHRALLAAPLTLTVMPLRADSPVYIDDVLRPQFAGRHQIAELHSARFIPIYRLDLAETR